MIGGMPGGGVLLACCLEEDRGRLLSLLGAGASWLEEADALAAGIAAAASSEIFSSRGRLLLLGGVTGITGDARDDDLRWLFLR